MNQVINYIKTNCNTRLSCLNAIMAYYNTFRYRPDLQYLTEIRVFDSFADRTIAQNQQILSSIYLYIEDGKIQESIDEFKHYIA